MEIRSHYRICAKLDPYNHMMYHTRVITRRTVYKTDRGCLRINTHKVSNIEIHRLSHFKSNNLTVCFVAVAQGAKDGVYIVVLKPSGVLSTVVDLWGEREGRVRSEEARRVRSEEGQ